MSNKLFETSDGSHSLFSGQYGVSYHSKHGAVQETQHVFINAALRLKALTQQDLHILDIGFGTGLNAYMTLFEAAKRNLKITYTAIEAYPISLDQATQLNYSQLLKKEAFQSTFLKMHGDNWGENLLLNDHFQFTKFQKKFEDLAFDNQFDIIYFDAFAPNSQPELWGEDILSAMYKALKPEGVMTTYCAKGVVKRTLKAVGFEIEALKGPPGKREMTRAIKTRNEE